MEMSPSASSPSHSIISPAILYWGTPVVIVSSENEDGTTNIAAMSSAFWLGHHCMLGFGSGSKTPQNIARTKQCVLNLPDDSMTDCINALSVTTGTEKVPPAKVARGYRYVKDKWTWASLTPQSSDFVTPARVKQCPVQMECELVAAHPLMRNMPDLHGGLVALEVRVMRVHVVDELRMEGHANRIDPDSWKPLIMSFQQLYGLRDGKAAKSTLARINEESYRPLTKSNIVKQLGDDDDKLAEEQFAAEC
jgi:flavin reductase (DIM6/NTAB) family NADH-FMN oxidoreductase RutF